MISATNNRAEIGRKNTCMVTLAARVDSSVAEVKNYYEIARDFEPIPNPEHDMWKLHYNAIKDPYDLKKKQKELDEEQKSSGDDTTEVSGQGEEECCNL